MSRYRAIHCMIWNDDKFPFSSDDCQLVFFHILTTTYSTPLGIYKASINALADEKRWDAKRYAKGFRECLAKGFVKYDERVMVILIPNHIKYNPPANPNVIINWKKIWDELPESDLKYEWYDTLKEYAEGYGKGFAKALWEPIRKGMPIQYQYQEQYQEQEQTTFCSEPEPIIVARVPLINRTEHPITQEDADQFAKAYPAVDIPAELEKIRAWCIANPTKRKTHKGVMRFVNSWLGRCQDRGGNGKQPQQAPIAEFRQCPVNPGDLYDN